MSLLYDLHSHSTASDGSLTPTELVSLARDNQVDVLALTDHDVTHGLHEAWQAAKQQDIRFIPGIEMSVSWRHQTIHIVGLGIDPDNANLQQSLESVITFRQQRAEKIAERLARAGIDGALEGAKKFAGGQILSRTHFGHFLVEQGYAKDMKKVFKKYLTRNKPGYVPGEWASLESALDAIKQAGGLAVLAHPARYAISNGRLKEFISDFKELGGTAIEVVSGSHSQDEVDRMAQLTSYFGLSASCGSDYHGPSNSYRELGQLHELPGQCQPVWATRAWTEMVERLGT